MSDCLDEAIIEGFICPICIKSFRTATVLKVHFDTAHNSIKPPPSDFSAPTVNFSQSRRPSISTINLAFYAQHRTDQAMGKFRSLTPELSTLRMSRINRDAMETTNLLIRMEKLLDNSCSTKAEERAYQQTVVSWIDSDLVDLCPSCGSSFGLGVEPCYSLDLPDSYVTTHSSGQNRFTSIASKGKTKLSQITNAILDYNPVYKRKHHCRLCGHVLCADCCFFLSRQGGMRMLERVAEQSFDKSSAERIQQQPEADGCELFTTLSDFPSSFNKNSLNIQYLRVCPVCKHLLEKKMNTLVSHYSNSSIVKLHTELRQLMVKIDETFPMYTEIAESLHAGEQRYPLEMARSMRHDLLEMLQQIDQIRQQLDNLASAKPSSTLRTPPVNLATVRLIRNICVLTRNFLQTKLPPLKALPTLHQYGSLAAQRHDELAARWAEEDRAVSRLEKRIAEQAPKLRSNQSVNPMCHNPPVHQETSENPIKQLSRIAEEIDKVSGQLMRAQNDGSKSLASSLSRELEQLENQFKELSACMQTSTL